ncbi:hypothetical protein NMY22_g6191 [Coprinellus aureogranulatus]|nr:hypothetical protein NMY22_g6191 [Coprinellus aureogranulatus]
MCRDAVPVVTAGKEERLFTNSLLRSSRDGGYVALSAREEHHEQHRSSTDHDAASTTSDSQPLLSNRTEDVTRSAAHGGSLTIRKDGSYAYSYGPKGLAGLRHNYYALLCAFFASIGGLEFGYDQGVIANVLVMEDFVKRWPITPLQKGIMTAVLELGALIGALCAGYFADKYSRRYSIVFACIIFCIGSTFQALAQNLFHLFLGRAIGGIGVGALSMLSPLYMAEISPPEVRGSLLALEQLSIVLGVVFGFWTGFVTRSIPGALSWRIPLGIQIIPGIILGLGCLLLPASPRWLVLKGRDEDALKSLARLRMRTPEEAEDDTLLQIELLEMKVETELVQRKLGVEGGKPSFKSELRAWGRLFDSMICRSLN